MSTTRPEDNGIEPNACRIYDGMLNVNIIVLFADLCGRQDANFELFEQSEEACENFPFYVLIMVVTSYFHLHLYDDNQRE